MVGWLTACGSAPPVVDPPPCASSGATMFQIDRRSDEPQRNPISTLTLHEGGAWSYREIVAGVARQRSGCLDRTSLDRVIGAVVAPWIAIGMASVCDAFSPNYTEYRARGALVRTERVCDTTALDDRSAKALATIVEILEPLTRNESK